MKNKSGSILWSIILICGIFTSSYLLTGRVIREADDRCVAAAVYLSDAEELASLSGESLEHWLAAFREAGVAYLIYDELPTAEELSLAESYDMLPAAAGNFDGDWAFIMPAMEGDESLGEELELSENTPLVLIKNVLRTSTVPPRADFDIETYNGDMVKGLYMYSEYCNRYSEARGGEELENLIFRAVTDRGTRLIILRPITYPDFSPVLESGIYAEVLSAVGQRLDSRGIELGREFSVLDAPVLQPLPQWAAGFIAVALWVVLLGKIPVFSGDKWRFILCILGLAGTGLATLWQPQLAQKLTSFACAVGFSCAAVLKMHGIFNAEEPSPLLKKRTAAVNYILAVLAVLLWSCLGGLSVAAIQTDRSYMMGETIFRGVKFSMLVPVCLAGILFVIPIFRRIRSEGLSRAELVRLLPGAVVIAAAMAVLIYRSGDIEGEISEFENRLRVAFEYAFFARPRTKEVFVAVPFMALLFVPAARKGGMLQLLGALCLALEAYSLVNTFCHGLVPIHVSLIRGVIAAGLGLVLGLIVITVFELWERRKKRA